MRRPLRPWTSIAGMRNGCSCGSKASNPSMATQPEWLGRLGRVLTRWRDGGLGTDWVVAVSGGSDSVGLLRALDAWASGLGLRLSVAHLDHGARGDAGHADAAFVAE